MEPRYRFLGIDSWAPEIRQIGLSSRPAGLRVAESIPWDRFLGSVKRLQFRALNRCARCAVAFMLLPHTGIVNSVQPEEVWLRTGRNSSYTLPEIFWQKLVFTLQIGDYFFLNLDCGEHTIFIFGLHGV